MGKKGSPAEAPSRCILEVSPADFAAATAALAAVLWTTLGLTGNSDHPLTIQGLDRRPMSVAVDDLRTAWRGTLDW